MEAWQNLLIKEQKDEESSMKMKIWNPGFALVWNFEKHGSYVKEIESDFMEEFFTENIDRYTWQLWFEKYDGKTYIFQVERLNGSRDSVLTVQLIQDHKLYPVLNYFLLDSKVCTYEKIER